MGLGEAIRMIKRITVDMDEDALRRVDLAAAAMGMSRNRCIVKLVKQELRRIDDARIDREFEEMGRDEERQREIRELEAFWAPLSDAALRNRLDEAEADVATAA
jgi:hypothetical protein